MSSVRSSRPVVDEDGISVAEHDKQEVVKPERAEVNVSPGMERLTASEIEALLKDMREAVEYYDKIWGRKKAI